MEGAIEVVISKNEEYAADEEDDVDPRTLFRTQQHLKSSVGLRDSIRDLSNVVASDISLFETRPHFQRRQSIIELNEEEIVDDDVEPITHGAPAKDPAALVLVFKALNQAMQGKTTPGDNFDDNNVKPTSSGAPPKESLHREAQENKNNHKAKLEDVGSIELLNHFMKSAGECLTWVESRELWSDMIKTNNGDQPSLYATWEKLLHKLSPKDGPPSAPDLVRFARALKNVYSIRLSDDSSEYKFVLMS